MPIDRASRGMIAAGMLLLMAGCTDERPSPFAPVDNFGEANRQTLAAQIIDPNPVYDSPMADSSGEHTAQAIGRYRTDKVKKPDRVQTSNTVTNSQ
ncbi:hypothetical protein [Sphingobium estronivorans]|uniref:hypothetical protein n=1 Tax=Sphingobium estronivorans TaxID=1577690 RepID=UPI001F07C1BF|nr:hypothetical protein [Sphingobium estronivorans]